MQDWPRIIRERTMLVADARRISQEWAEETVAGLPGFHGAFFAGSINTLPEAGIYPAASDVDIKIVMDDPPNTGGPQKIPWGGVVLDVSYASTGEFRSPEAVLGSYYTAPHFTVPSILLDPTGHLAAIQAVVARDYAQRRWVVQRCEHARREVEGILGGIDPTAPFPTQILFWVVALSFTTHIVLVADLRNPTHRRGPVVMREVLGRRSDTSLHERYLEIVGSSEMDRAAVEALLESCTEAFDAASAVRTTPYLMGSNISAEARPMAIGGIEEIIEEGCHREAVFWILLIHTLSQIALDNDAPDDIRSRLTPGYERVLEALGIGTESNLRARAGQLGDLLSDLSGAAREIIATHPAIMG